ncbi:hypothetical protein NKI60_36115, partial [Mesorhizobium sp. M0520]
RSPGGLQRFVSTLSALRNLFVPPRPKRSALAIHVHRLSAMALVISRRVCTARPTPQVPTL